MENVLHVLIENYLIFLPFNHINVVLFPDPFLYDWVNHLQEIMKERKQEIINGKQFMPCEGKEKNKKYYIKKC